MSDRTLIQGLARTLIDASQTFAGEEWPAALIWPDPERQWFSAFADLRRRLALQHVGLYALGDYAPDDGIGPAIWIRCVVEASDAPDLKGVVVGAAHSVVLLPGISWRDLREPLTLTKSAQMLVDMQYRGDVFRQRRQARDWTVATFLRDPDQGLGLDVSTDSRTDESARRALAGLLDLPLDGWRQKRLSADDFDSLLVEDKERDLLRWIADPDAVRAGMAGAAWSAFRDQIERDYRIDLEQKGALQTAIERLARRSGAWVRVWNRLAAEPHQFRSVCERIREATSPKQGNLLGGLEEGDPVTSPHDNALAEKILTQELSAIAQLPSREAAAKVIALEERHRARRDTLWAKLGEAPLARALEPLTRLAAATETALLGDDLTAIATAYCEEGWRVDRALIETIAAARTREDVVARAAGALYRPWVDPLARRFRAAVEAAGNAARPHPLAIEAGTLVLFVDGLRMDLGHEVAELLNNASVAASLTWRLSPVPSLTATAKPLVTPVGDSIAGKGKVDAFQPLEASSGKPASIDVLRKAMLARGIQVLNRNEALPPERPTSIGYAECGNIDNDGHNMGLRLAGQLDTELARIAGYAKALKAAGWSRVRIVTDHGWLLMPGGFEVVRLPPSAVIAKGSRAAILQEQATAELSFLPWHWDGSVRIAVPPGAEAFRAGEVYSHGGLSPQECVIPDIAVGGETAVAGTLRISSISWRRLRLTVELSGEGTDFTVEVRRKERDPASRVDVASTIEGARARLTVSDEIEEGDPVLVVVIDRHGSVIDARATRVGERV
ncbi:BREX-1 system phosphatase PglZ type B [Bradyrhizobium sp. Tv2a-2]|uniref:BREX-1 system phosphatase PglZ type B n=1 Tax=Bradyrhizobium sp. Tv2a-2 TaxID=113395 RepID=UPI00040CC032|nr:BREX-1 system phosphatase PglZ type B [Bradyrhizobium sp. Tv2a-2]